MNFLECLAFFLVIAAFVIGILANVFIALVNCIDWTKRKKISSADGILTGLAISRTGLLWVIVMGSYLTLFNTRISRKQVTLAHHVAWVVSNHLSIWLATILSIFYLLKIANFSSLLFLQLKRRVESIIFVLLLGMLLFLSLNFTMEYVGNTLVDRYDEGNMTWKSQLKDMIQLSSLTVFTLENSVPFFTSLVCVLLLIYSLCKHLRKMKLYGKGAQDSSTKVHVKALQTMASFLLLFAVYTFSVTTLGWYFNKPPNESFYLLCRAASSIYPSGHSCVLIWANKKLKQAFLSVVCWVRCWLKEWKRLSP
ncbi:taste receptor type 2 member 19-like [Perognathus longimembris pacificus]|uniref:taste receptor type 2 member 19-like n=1 Tax=Perognathus longimembris pacificus TaxID=214514 RepID=UPI002019021D|nr:taste receptor type 2 member 19-like [Perognathus longimembris pacificus]